MKKLRILMLSLLYFFLVGLPAFAQEATEAELHTAYEQLGTIFTKQEFDQLQLSYEEFAAEYAAANAQEALSVAEYLESYASFKEQLQLEKPRARGALRSLWSYNVGTNLEAITLKEEPVYDNYALLESGIRPGDIIYEADRGIWVAHHIAIVDDVVTEKRMVDGAEKRVTYIRTIEAIGDGVVYGVFDDERANHINATILRPKEATNAQMKAAVQFARTQLGKPYSLVSDLLNRDRSTLREDWYCSMLIWAAYMNATPSGALSNLDEDDPDFKGINLETDKLMPGVTPRDIRESTAVNKVKYDFVWQKAGAWTSDYTSGLHVSVDKADKPDFTLPQKVNGYSYLDTGNHYYIVEKTKENRYRYAKTGYLALHKEGNNFNLEWWSGRSDIPDQSVDVQQDYFLSYENFPTHPWKDKNANEIMQWLNHWSTSEFFLVESSKIAEDIALASLGQAEFIPSLDMNIAYLTLSRTKENTIYGTKDYTAGLQISANRDDKPDLLLPQRVNGYSYLSTSNQYYIVEKTKENRYRYAKTGYLALHKTGNHFDLEWWSGYSDIPDRPIEMEDGFEETYQDYPLHPWQDVDANFIMRWLNHWSTSDFFLVKSANMAEDMARVSIGQAEFTAAPDEDVAYSVISREAENHIYGTKDYVADLRVSVNRDDKPDLLLPQKGNGYSYLTTGNYYYIVERTKHNAYRYAKTGSLALHKEGNSFNLEWWSGRSDIPDRPVEMKDSFQGKYQDYPLHPWQDVDGNFIMRWLNHWSTSEFMIIHSLNIEKDLAELAQSHDKHLF